MATLKEITRLTTEGRLQTRADIPLPDVSKADEVLAQGRRERPTAEDMASWVHSADCPAEAIESACERLTALLGHNISPPLELSRNGDRVHVWRLDNSRTEKRKHLNAELRRQIDEDRKSTGDGILLVDYDVMEHTDDNLRNNVFTPQPQARHASRNG